MSSKPPSCLFLLKGGLLSGPDPAALDTAVRLLTFMVSSSLWSSPPVTGRECVLARRSLRPINVWNLQLAACWPFNLDQLAVQNSAFLTAAAKAAFHGLVAV